MSDEQTNNNDEKAVDLANDVDKSDPASDPAKSPKKKPRRARAAKANRAFLPIIFFIIVLGVIGVIGVGGNYAYRLYLQTLDTYTLIKQSQSANAESGQEFEDGVLKRIETMQASQDEMKTQQQEMTDYIAVLREKNQLLRKDWLIMESEYLIQLANYRLLFDRDINTSIVALEAADQRMRESGDPGIINVRKAVAEAVLELKQIPQADLAGLSLRLSAINKEIDKLPQKTPDPKSKAMQQQQQNDQVGQKVDSWSQLPSAIWQDLKTLVVIRDHDAPVQPMLAPKERFFLIENVRLQLEQARLAMLAGQADVYKERISTAIDWISQHFDTDANITKATLDSLNRLVNESIAPPLPDIAYTYQALQKYRQGRDVPVVKLVPATKNDLKKQAK